MKKAFLIYNYKFEKPIKVERFGIEVTKGYEKVIAKSGEVFHYNDKKEVINRINELESIKNDYDEKKYFYVREVSEEEYNNF